MRLLLGWLVLLSAGLLSLPLAASVLDDHGAENWIVPVQVVAVALVGAALGAALPGFVSGSTGRRVAIGATYGIVAAVLGLAVFFLLLSGIDGA